MRRTVQNLTSLPTQHSPDARLDLGDDAEEREVKADVVVLAAGGWCPYLGELAGGVSIPVIPVLGIMWSTAAQKTNQVGSQISDHNVT